MIQPAAPSALSSLLLGAAMPAVGGEQAAAMVDFAALLGTGEAEAPPAPSAEASALVKTLLNAQPATGKPGGKLLPGSLPDGRPAKSDTDTAEDSSRSSEASASATPVDRPSADILALVGMIVAGTAPTAPERKIAAPTKADTNRQSEQTASTAASFQAAPLPTRDAAIELGAAPANAPTASAPPLAGAATELTNNQSPVEQRAVSERPSAQRAVEQHLVDQRPAPPAEGKAAAPRSLPGEVMVSVPLADERAAAAPAQASAPAAAVTPVSLVLAAQARVAPASERAPTKASPAQSRAAQATSETPAVASAPTQAGIIAQTPLPTAVTPVSERPAVTPQPAEANAGAPEADAPAQASRPATTEAARPAQWAAAPEVSPMISVAGISTVQPTSPAPGAPVQAATVAGHDFTALVDRLVEARDAAVPQPVQTSVLTAEFGRVSLRFDHDDRGLTVAMNSADPDFARAVQAAQPAASAQTGDNTGGSQRQEAPAQQSAGPNSSGPQGQQSQAQSSARQQQDAHPGQARGSVRSGPADTDHEDTDADPRGGIYA